MVGWVIPINSTFVFKFMVGWVIPINSTYLWLVELFQLIEHTYMYIFFFGGVPNKNYMMLYSFTQDVCMHL